MATTGGLLSSDGLRFGGSEAWVVMPAMVPREAGRRVSLAHNLAASAPRRQVAQAAARTTRRQGQCRALGALGRRVGVAPPAAAERAQSFSTARTPAASSAATGCRTAPARRPASTAPNASRVRIRRAAVARALWRPLPPVRANPARHGRAFVQMTSPAVAAARSGRPFAPSRLTAAPGANVYFFAVAQPGRRRRLARSSRSTHRGGGWSLHRRLARERPLVAAREPAALRDRPEAQPFGGDRAIHQPAAGLVRRGDAVMGLRPRECARRHREVGRRRGRRAPRRGTNRRRVCDVPVERLERWTREALASLSLAASRIQRLV